MLDQLQKQLFKAVGLVLTASEPLTHCAIWSVLILTEVLFVILILSPTTLGCCKHVYVDSFLLRAAHHWNVPSDRPQSKYKQFDVCIMLSCQWQRCSIFVNIDLNFYYYLYFNFGLVFNRLCNFAYFLWQIFKLLLVQRLQASFFISGL